MLGRNPVRPREVALRRLWARAYRLIRQLMTEVCCFLVSGESCESDWDIWVEPDKNFRVGRFRK